MALHFPLMVNDTQIGYFYALRTSGTTDPDSLNTYTVEIYANGETYVFTDITHRYGLGAWSLIATVLTKSELTGLTHVHDTPNTE